MRRHSIVLLFMSACFIGACSERQGYTRVRVWNTTYDFPTKYLRVSEPGNASPYVLLDSNDVQDPDSFILEYEMREQKPTWPSGLPRISWITFADTKPADLVIRPMGDHEVVCERTKISLGLRYPCGIAFTERGARWTVRFGTRWMQQPAKVLAQALDLLRQAQRPPST